MPVRSEQKISRSRPSQPGNSAPERSLLTPRSLFRDGHKGRPPEVQAGPGRSRFSAYVATRSVEADLFGAVGEDAFGHRQRLVAGEAGTVLVVVVVRRRRAIEQTVVRHLGADGVGQAARAARAAGADFDLRVDALDPAQELAAVADPLFGSAPTANVVGLEGVAVLRLLAAVFLDAQAADIISRVGVTV